MDHNEIRHKLSEYIDDAVTPQERATIDDHLKTCTTCSNALAELRKTIEQVKQIEDIEAPVWMTRKIMANVRSDAEERKGFFHRLFYPLAVKLPIQAVAVLFLTVTVYYIYSSTHPAEKYAEAPMGRLAKQETPVEVRDAAKDTASEVPAQKEMKVSQGPGYKSLDMKYEYEKPSPPRPAEAPAAAAPAKRAAPRQEKGETARDERPAAPHAAAPSMMAEQAAPSGSLRSYGLLEQEKSIKRNAGPSRSADSGKKELPITTDRSKEEAEEINAVTVHFVQKDLPADMKVKGLSFVTYKYSEDLPSLQWIKESRAFKRNPCNNRYLVDVDLSGHSSKYLYCYDRSQIKLLGVYKRINDAWSEKD
jgi:hypothetical protein